MQNAPLTFTVQSRAEGSLARAGKIITPHGTIETPAFLPVGTKATVKSLKPEDLVQTGAQALLANTYHLYLSPGHEVLAAAGGLAEFANWRVPTMTDSGGFQVFSLGAAFGKGVTKFAANEPASSTALNVYAKEVASAHGKLCVIDEEGVTFTSHYDGSLHRFTAERAIEIQHHIGADIIVAFDECTSPTADYTYQVEAMHRTHRWAKRSLLAHKQNYTAAATQGLYAVVQGGRHADLRRASAETLAEMGFDGFGIGGSFSKADLGESLRVVNEALPDDKPRHLLGIGEPDDILAAVAQGCDTFDCVAPTRLARNGTIYFHANDGSTRSGITKLNLTRQRYQRDFSAVDECCECPVCTQYSKAYLCHLFRNDEMLGAHLATIHNLYTIVQFTSTIRAQICRDAFSPHPI